MSRQRSMETIENSEYVTIGELVRLTGLRYSTLKFYTEENMLLYEQADQQLTRRYKRLETIQRILLIKELREQGNTIPQIKAIITKSDEPTAQ